jgi:hypothetical protein
LSSKSAEASHAVGGTPAADSQAVHINVVNPATARSFVLANIVGNPTLLGINGPAAFSMGVGDGVQGLTDKGGTSSGVHGRNTGANGMGVFGDGGATGAGVAGSAGDAISFVTPPSGVGVYGLTNAASGTAVRGRITGGPANTIAVYGENFSTSPGPNPGAGGFGCYGFSSFGHGLVGGTGTAGGGGVVGATNGVVGAHAGIFFGSLVVVGGPKSAAVEHPDGTHRLLYCMESPESWFEDFGNATLEHGRARISIDEQFAAVADMSDYHVFLTPYGNTRGLHVAARTPTDFSVEEHDCGSASIAFGWRVVAKRKDIDAARFAKVILPAQPPPPPTPPSSAVEGAIVPAPMPKKHSHGRPQARRATTPKNAATEAQPKRP